MGAKGRTRRPRPDDVMGKTLSNAKKTQRQELKARLATESGTKHTTDANALQSVWEVGDLDGWLQNAEQNQQQFAADRDVRMVVQGVTHVYHDDKLRPLDQDSDATKWYEMSKKLPIPVRPKWDHRMDKREVEEREYEAFLAWRRQLSAIEEKEGVIMTPYERNLEVWRQLWRVIERSDVVVYIVDARNPLAFRSRATEKAILSAGRTLVLLLNKAELLTERQREAWGAYFKKEGITALFFSAQACKDELDAKAGIEKDKGREGAREEKSATGEDRVLLDAMLLAEERAGQEEQEMKEFLAHPDDAPEPAAEEHADPEKRLRNGKKPRRQQKKLKGAPAQHAPAHGQQNRGVHPLAQNQVRAQKKKGPAAPEPPTEGELERTDRLKPVLAAGGLKAAMAYHAANVGHVYSAEQLIDFFLLHRKAGNVKDTAKLEGEPVHIGFIGYPNVGKSSTINVLWESKKVTVSATPGKTKHFQTLILPAERRVMLCDCPGLVFPSFATTRDHMVVDGILPVSQLKDAIVPMGIVEKRISKETFEMMYTLNLDWTTDLDESPTNVHFLCNQYARVRGLMTDHDKPNVHRSARAILTDYIAGKLVFVQPPPGMTIEQAKMVGAMWDASDEEGEEYEEIEEIEEIEEVEEDEEEEEEEIEGGLLPEPVNWDHVVGPADTTKEATAEELFNKNNTCMDAIYAKVNRPKTKKERKAKHQMDGEQLQMNENGEVEVQLSDDDGIEMIEGPEILIEDLPQRKPTKRQMRMNQKHAVRGRIGCHTKGGPAGKAFTGYAGTYQTAPGQAPA